jgi:hypothetical protein
MRAFSLLTMATLGLTASIAIAQELPAPPAPRPAQPQQTASNGAAPSASTVRPTDDPEQRVRCRSIQATGSLVRRERVCRTVAEWRRIGQAGNDRARDVVGTGTICSGGQCGNGG